MSELLRKAVEKARILRARPHLKPVAAGGGELSKMERWRTAQMARDWLNANADPKYHKPRLPDMEENGQFKLLTRGRLGMRLKEFRYYQPPGGFYGNPYDKDFVQERQKDRRNGLIKAGIVGAGLLGGGALLGRGLYKVGKSGAVRRAEDLAEELTKLRATKAAADVPQVAPAPRGRPKNTTPPPAPPQTAAPTPPPQTPATPPPTGKKPQSKVVENLNKQGDLPPGAADAEIGEIKAATGEAPKPRKLTPKQQKLAKRQARVAKFAAAQSTPPPTAPTAPAAVPTKAPAAAKAEATPAKATKKPQTTPEPVASATNEEFWEKPGVGKVPLTGTPEERAAFSKKLEEIHGAGGFKGKAVADVIDEARFSLNSDKLREVGRANNKNLTPKKNSKATKESKAKKDAIADEPDASPDEADWEANLKENPQVRAKKNSAKSTKGKASAAKKPAAKKGKKSEAPLSYAERLAAKVKAKRDRKKNLSALLSRVRYFNQFQTDEAGIPLTGRVARDRFVKKLRDEDLDRRDANILRAGGAGALAGLLARGRIGAGKRALIGAGAGGLGVIGIRALTNNDRDIYGERDRGSKRAELLPAVGGLGAAAWLAGKRLKAFAKKFNHGGVKELGRGFYSAKLLPSERWVKRADPRGWVQDEVLPAPDKHSAYSKYVADKMRAMRRLNSGNIPYTQRAKKPVEWLSGAQAQLPSYYFSSRLRGVKEFARGKYAIPALGKMLKDQSLMEEFMSGQRGPKLGDLDITKDLKIKLAGNPKLARSMAKKNVYLGPGRLTHVNTEARSWAADALRRGRNGDQILTPENHYRIVRGYSPTKGNVNLRNPKSFIVWPPRNLESTDLSSRLRGVKEFGSMSSARLLRKVKAHLSNERGHLLVSEMPNTQGFPGVSVISERPSYSGWAAKHNNLLKKLRYKNTSGALRRGKYGEGLGVGVYYDFSTRLRGVKNFDDYRLYYFKGRNTGIAARSAEEARKKKKRGGDELVAVRTPNETERSQMARGIWVRTRRDGKSPQKSRYGKGRGQGPARKSLSAKLRVKFFEKREKRGMNPYVGAALSGFGSGAALGSLALLKRGATFRGAAKTAAKLGLASAGIVGGGALLGSKIVGDPRKEESAPFMKRAAIGGTLVGAGAGLGGALLLRKTKGGARALVAASKKTEPFSRPAMWLRKSPLLGAAGIGAVGGALYGGGMGADEGQQVDSIRNIKKDLKKFSVGSFQFSGKRLREFSALSDTAKRAAKAVGGWAKRNGTAIGLTGAGVGASVAASRYYGPSNKGWKKLDEQKDFSARLRLFGRGDQARWDARSGGGVLPNEDSQFANTAWGWATDRPMYVAKRDDTGRIVRDNNGDAIRLRWDPSSGQLWNSIAREAKNKRVTVQRGGRLSRDLVDELRGAPRQRDASGRIKKREWEKSWFHNKATEIGMTAAGLGGLATVRYANNNPDTKIGKAWTNTQKSLRATKDGLADIGKNILGGITKITAKKAFSAKLKRLRELDAIAEYEGWDIRDPRGRSARVFAPGSRRRERRQKEWYEKTENERKLWKAGLVASALGGAGAMLVGQRLVSGKSLIPSRFLKKPIDPSGFAQRPPTAKEADEILKKFNKIDENK